MLALESEYVSQTGYYVEKQSQRRMLGSCSSEKEKRNMVVLLRRWQVEPSLSFDEPGKASDQMMKWLLWQVYDQAGLQPRQRFDLSPIQKDYFVKSSNLMYARAKAASSGLKAKMSSRRASISAVLNFLEKPALLPGIIPDSGSRQARVCPGVTRRDIREGLHGSALQAGIGWCGRFGQILFNPTIRCSDICGRLR